MIVTVKVLGLRARDAGTVAAAARRVTEYVEGGGPAEQTAGRTSAYYAEDGKAQGRARGAGAGLTGLRGTVTSEQLQRLLRGRHAATRLPRQYHHSAAVST